MTIVLPPSGLRPSSTEGGPTIYPVTEWGFVDVPTEDLLDGGHLSVYRSVEKYFTLRPQRGSLQLQAQGWIGIIPLNERVTIEVTPRVPLSNLSRVLRVVEDDVSQALENTARLYEQEPDLYPSLVDLYARTLAGHVENIALRGLLRDYTERREITSFPRGRILLGETAKSLQPKGIAHKVATSRYERTSDNACNRCIKYAIWFLARHRRDTVDRQRTTQSRIVRQALNRAYRAFDGVGLDLQRSFLRDPVVSGRHPLPQIRAYYRPVLDLCLAIIRQQAVSLDRESGDIGLPSLVVNMSDAFEIYVRKVLAAHARTEQWRGRVLDGNVNPPDGGAKQLFHSGSDIGATPDIVVASLEDGEWTYPVVLEVKYKPSDASLSRSRADVNQVIAYGVSYRSKHVILIRPRGASADNREVGLHPLGTIDDVTFHHYVYDLGAQDLAVQERLLGQVVGALMDE